MEEILASIRQIISEDGDGGRTQEAKGEKAGAAGHRSQERSARSEQEEHSAGTEPQAIALDEADIEPEPEPEFEHEPEPASSFVHGVSMTPHSSAGAAEADPYATFGESSRQPKLSASSSSQRHDFGSEAQRLLSSESGSAVHGAFSALAHTILAQNARTLEDLVAEMLQPMLKTWLDENLPQLVERLVQEEIQRVSRGKR
jgi:cell pole-organizing protein PopZ